MTSEQEQINALRQDLAAAQSSVSAIEAKLDVAVSQLDRLTDALMKPQPGQSLGFIDRVGIVVLDAESAKRTAKMLMTFVAFVAAIGAAIKIGINPWVAK